MPDAFDALRAPLTPIAPDPAFAARLRARVAQALGTQGGITVTLSQPTLDIASVPNQPTATAPAGVIPYLIVGDARRALDWYVEALGATRRGEPYVMPDGRIGHAELELSGAPVYLADEAPQSHVAAPLPGEDARVSLTLLVADVDAVVARATAAGAELERPAADNPYGRNAVVRDPYGHRWIVSAPAPDPATAATAGTMRHGDVGYASLQVGDVERAAAFFGSVLGWSFAPGSGAQGRHVVGQSLSHGLWGGQERSTLLLCFAVDDVDSAVERVRRAGGSAAEPEDRPYGRLADCVDDQGVPFALFRPAPGTPRPKPNGSLPGDLGYVTIEVVDSAKARAFYGAVLGWRFSPGRVGDGWTVEDVVPMTGMHGGNAQACVVPLYRVTHLEAALARVGAAGGTAAEVETQPYGRTALCRDDQGTRFYLWEA